MHHIACKRLWQPQIPVAILPLRFNSRLMSAIVSHYSETLRGTLGVFSQDDWHDSLWQRGEEVEGKQAVCHRSVKWGHHVTWLRGRENAEAWMYHKEHIKGSQRMDHSRADETPQRSGCSTVVLVNILQSRSLHYNTLTAPKQSMISAFNQKHHCVWQTMAPVIPWFLKAKE